MRLLVLVGFLAVSSVAAAAPPVIYTSFPSKLVADQIGAPQEANVTLHGDNLALPTTTGFTFDNDVLVYARWADSAAHAPDNGWHKARDAWFMVTGWNPSTLQVNFTGIDNAGTIQIAVNVGHTADWAYFNVPVRGRATAPPIFWNTESLYASVLPVSVDGSDRRRLVRFTAVNLDSNSSTKIYLSGNGYTGFASIADVHPGENWGEFYLPASMQATACVTGCTVWVANKINWSAPAPLVID